MSKEFIRDRITIVVPCKNEQDYIGNLLYDLAHQEIGTTRIIIADASTDNTRAEIEKYKRYLNIEVIDGGPVSIAKNNGAKLVTTPYILFIDSDVRFFDNNVILESVMELEKSNLDLIGLKIKCYDGNLRTEIGFKVFNLINKLISFKIPFAVGAFMLTRREAFERYGGFAQKYETSEDFFLSKQYDVKKFKILNHYFGQDSRRFERMGYFGMAWYLLKNFWNRNNEQYWQNLDYSRYWK